MDTTPEVRILFNLKIGCQMLVERRSINISHADENIRTGLKLKEKQGKM